MRDNENLKEAVQILLKNNKQFQEQQQKDSALCSEMNDTISTLLSPERYPFSSSLFLFPHVLLIFLNSLIPTLRSTFPHQSQRNSTWVCYDNHEKLTSSTRNRPNRLKKQQRQRNPKRIQIPKDRKFNNKPTAARHHLLHQITSPYLTNLAQ